MKPQDFATALISAAELMGEPQLAQLAEAIRAAAPATVAAMCKKMTPREATSSSVETSLKQTVARLERFVSAYGATPFKADVKSLDTLLRVIGPIDVSGFEALMRSSSAPATRAGRAAVVPNEEGVRWYLRQLEVALGDDEGFKQLHQRLATDETMGKGDVVAIAKQFSGKGGKSKPDALKSILQRHQTLMGLRAKEQSRDGRSAA